MFEPVRPPGRFLTTAFLIAVLHGAAATETSQDTLRQHLLVVYNSNSPDSTALAHEYARLRNIPPERVLGIATSLEEEISRDEFENTLRRPIERFMMSKGWLQREPTSIQVGKTRLQLLQAINNKVWAIALIRGIPLKIRDDHSLPQLTDLANEFQTSAAAVDSELALLPFAGLPARGFVGNAFFAEKTTRAFNQYFADSLILVTRLDGPDVSDVQRMMHDSLAVEELELMGKAKVDTRGIFAADDPYRLGDVWLRSCAETLRLSGFPTQMDSQSSVFPPQELWSGVAFYLGWYAPHASGPMMAPEFNLSKGAVAYHIHSFSASTIRSSTAHWVGPLINRGAAATMGCVYEPYLQFSPDPRRLIEGLLSGLTFAEAAYQSQIVLSWMTTFVGDPLYRPFPRNFFQETLPKATAQPGTQHDLALIRQMTIESFQNRNFAVQKTLKRLLESATTAEGWEAAAEWSERLGVKKPGPAELLKRALAAQPSPIQAIRITKRLAHFTSPKSDPEAFVQLMDKLLDLPPEVLAHYDLNSWIIATIQKIGWQYASPRIKQLLVAINETSSTNPAANPRSKSPQHELTTPPALDPTLTTPALQPAIQ